MELEVSEQVGPDRHERAPERKTYRMGTRSGSGRPRWGRCPGGFPSCGKGATFRACRSPDGGRW